MKIEKMYKVLYFNSGDGEDGADESIAYPASSLRGFLCRDATNLFAYFDSIKDTHQDTTADNHDLITLTITSGTHRSVIKAITDEIAYGDQAFITVCNKDDEVFLDAKITNCAITPCD